MSKNQLPKKEPLNKFIRLSGVGLQMGITIYVAAYFGKKIDAHYQFDKKLLSPLYLNFICFCRHIRW